MNKLKSNFINMVAVLSSITIFAAILIASIHVLTKEPLKSLLIKKKQEAIQAVLPPHDHFDLKPIEFNNGVETTKIYKAYDISNVFVGAAVESSSNNGYIGKIDIIVGFNKEGVIVNYSILEQHETPGLGSKMVDWFKTDKAKQNIIGKNAANLNINKDGGEVDAITAATISSRAFLFAIRNAYFEFKSNLEVPVKDTKSEVDTIFQKQNDTTSVVNKIEMKGQHK